MVWKTRLWLRLDVKGEIHSYGCGYRRNHPEDKAPSCLMEEGQAQGQKNSQSSE